MEIEFEFSVLDSLRFASLFATQIDRSGGCISGPIGELAGQFARVASLFPHAQDGTLPIGVLTEGGDQDTWA